MSARRCREARRVSLRCGCLILFIALLLMGAARPGAALTAPMVSFRPPITYDQPVPAGLERVTGEPLMAADLDGDGRLDLAVITRQGLSILYGNGDGTFAPPVDLPLGPGLQEGTVADVNGDGLPDLVYCDFDRGKVAVLINQGGRQFSSPYYYAASDGPVGITAADFNGDGKPDLAVSCHLSGDLVVLLNRGDGTFLPPVSLGRIDYPGGVISGDFNGDGKIDLAETSLTENVVRILLGDGTGQFKEGGRYSTDSAYANRVVAADFNGDGIPDLAVACQSEYAILFGDGKGGFGPAIRYPGLPLVDAGDFDGDGAPDLIAPGADAGGFSLYLNRQAGNFLPPQAFPGPGGKADGVVVGDFNGDGRPDVVTWNEGSPHLAVFLNDTPQPTPAIRSLTLDAASVIGGCQTVTGTVTLTAPAQGAIGGVVVLLTSSNPAVAVPAELLIPQGALQGSFSVVTPATAEVQWESISASYAGTAKRAALAVRPMGPPQVTINPVQVIGGQTAAGQVTIPCPAGPGGLAIPLTSSSPLASVPGALTVPPGATTTAFPIRTAPVAAAATATISAGPPGGAATASVQLLPPFPPPPPPVPPTAPSGLTLTLFPSSVPGGVPAIGQVTLPGPAGLLPVRLASSNPAVAAVPASIAVLPGTSTATFPITTFPVAAATTVVISAVSASGAANAILLVLPPTPVPAPPPPPQPLDLLANGSFEEPPAPEGGFVTVGPGGLPGWQILRGTVDVVNSGYWQAAPDGGSQSIDLVGTPGAATIEQSFPTVPGQLYLFTGWISHNPDNPVAPMGRANVYLNGQFFVQLFHYDPQTTRRDMRWVPFADEFVATSWTTTLTLADVTNTWDAGGGLTLDGLSVTPVTGGNPPAPPPVGGLPAPTNLAARFIPGAGIQLTWQDNGSDETAFAVWRRGGGVDWARIAALAPHTTAYFDANIAPGVTYTYRVRAIRVDVASDWSNEVTVTAALLVNGTASVPSGPQETLTATFTQPDGGVTVNAYEGYVLLHVTGVGQSYGPNYNDAFYLFNGPFNAPQNGWDGGYYQLAFGTSPLQAFDAGNDAKNFLVGPLPPYNPAHDYTFVLNTGLSSPGFLHFGVSDGGFNDNSGAYVITVSQLAPLP